MQRSCNQTSVKPLWAWAVSNLELLRCKKATARAWIKRAKEQKSVFQTYKSWVMQYDIDVLKYRHLNIFKLWHKLFKKHSGLDLSHTDARQLKRCMYINQQLCSTLKLLNCTRNSKTTTALSTVATCLITVKFQSFSSLNCMAAKRMKS